jgi:hypothetical protein
MAHAETERGPWSTKRALEDLEFFRTTFHKLLLNFTWSVNRKDRLGKNVFERPVILWNVIAV